MKARYISLIISTILMTIFILVGLVLFYIGNVVIGTNMSKLYFSYFAMILWVLAILMLITFIHNLVHKEFKVKKAKKVIGFDPKFDNFHKKFERE